MWVPIERLKEEFSDVRTVDLISKSKKMAERLFWFLIATSGTMWFFIFMSFQFEIWNRNSIQITKADVNLSDLNYPAVTFCSKSANKYGVAERVGNYLNANSDLEHEFFSWIRAFSIGCALFLIRRGETGSANNYYIDIYKENCLTYTVEHTSPSCEVLLIEIFSPT